MSRGGAKFAQRDVPRAPVGDGDECIKVGDGVFVEPYIDRLQKDAELLSARFEFMEKT